MKTIKASDDAHGKLESLKADTGKTMIRLLDEAVDAREILPRMIAALEKGEGNHKLLAEAKTIV